MQAEMTDIVVSFLPTMVRGKFPVTDPREEDFRIEDIANALSNLCRYGGNVPFFYSVAQHCVLCAQMAPDDLKFEALMHDRAEAYLVDVPRSVKRLLKGYLEIEARFEEVSARKFGVSPIMLPGVKIIDNRMAVTECDQFYSHHEDKWWLRHGIDPYPELAIEPWTPAQARTAFLTAYEAYKP